MKKYYVIYGTLGLIFVASFIALWVNRHSLPITPYAGGYRPTAEPTAAGNIILIAAAVLVVIAIAAFIIYRIYSRIHKK